MSTNQHDGGDGTDKWDPAAIRRRLPSGLTDKQKRSLVCAIRNPGASPTQIAKKVGVPSSYQVANALRSLLLGVVDDKSPESTQAVMDARGEMREAEAYGELTDKQQAVIDFAAENPQFVEAPSTSYADISQALLDQESVAVSETYLGRVMRKYSDILQQRRALVAASGEGEQELESVTADMTVREMLEAAGYALPDKNLDTMPEVDKQTSGGSQATLGEADGTGDFQPASEVAREVGEVQEQAEEQVGEDEDEESEEQETVEEGPDAPSYEVNVMDFTDGWPDVPGADEASRLPDDADDEDVKPGQAYIGYVNGVRSFGVFVSLTHPAYGDDVSGLLPKEQMHGTPDQYDRLDYVVVYLDELTPKGFRFMDWEHKNPEGEDDGDEANDEAEAEAEVRDTRLATMPDDEALAALDERVSQQAQQMEVLAERIRGLREDAVMASEVREFGDEVEERLGALADRLPEDLEERLEEAEGAQGEAAEEALAQAEQNSERLATLQEMVNALAEEQEKQDSLPGILGRTSADLQRLADSDYEVEHYHFSHEGDRVNLKLEATEATQEGSDD